MPEWIAVLLPAIGIALIVRIDAILIGPYFALSAVLGGSEGVDAYQFYESKERRSALLRRFSYPAIAGFALSWTTLTWIQIVSIGLVSAFLLVWPVIFHGLPWQVPRRTWHLPVLYTSFIFAFPALAGLGAELQSAFTEVAAGDIRSWLREEIVSTLTTGTMAFLLGAVYQRTFARLRDESERRESAGSEVGDFDDEAFGSGDAGESDEDPSY